MKVMANMNDNSKDPLITSLINSFIEDMRRRGDVFVIVRASSKDLIQLKSHLAKRAAV